MTDISHESVLMRRVSGGDREGFEELVRIHADGLLTFLCRTNGDYHLGEELFQEVFLSVWRKRRTYKYPKPVKPWLYRIALNVSRSSWRKARLPMEHVETIESVARSLPDEPERRVVDQETIAIANEAVLGLPLQQRTVVALRIFSEMTYREIGEVMDLAEGSVRSHMSHAIKSLRNRLGSRMSTDQL